MLVLTFIMHIPHHVSSYLHYAHPTPCYFLPSLCTSHTMLVLTFIMHIPHHVNSYLHYARPTPWHVRCSQWRQGVHPGEPSMWQCCCDLRKRVIPDTKSKQNLNHCENTWNIHKAMCIQSELWPGHVHNLNHGEDTIFLQVHNLTLDSIVFFPLHTACIVEMMIYIH